MNRILAQGTEYVELQDLTRRSRKRPMSTSKTTVRVQPRQNPDVIIFMNPNSCLFFAIWDDIHVTFHAAYVVITFHYNNRKKQLKISSLTFVVSFSHCRFVVETQKVKGWNGNSWALGDLRMAHSFLWQVDKARAWVTV